MQGCRKKLHYPVLFSMVLAITASGCYHAIIESGRQPSATTVEDRWADSFLGGLVPPNPVDVSSRCPNGIARVETQLSFLNLLAGMITFGIYTPMHLKAVCAAGGGDAGASNSVHVPAAAERADIERALQEAARLSARTGEPAWLVFDRE